MAVRVKSSEKLDGSTERQVTALLTLLAENGTIVISGARIAREIGVSRSTVYQGICRIRTAFTAAGLEPSPASYRIPKSHIENRGRGVTTECCGPSSGERNASRPIVAQKQPDADDGTFRWRYDSGREYLNQIAAYKSYGRAGDDPSGAEGREAA